MSEIQNRFTGHLVTPGTRNRMVELRRRCRELARFIEETCPQSREKATALTELSFVMMSANSALAQRDPIDMSEIGPGEPVFATVIDCEWQGEAKP